MANVTFGYFNTVSLSLTGPVVVSDDSVAKVAQGMRPGFGAWLVSNLSRMWI